MTMAMSGARMMTKTRSAAGSGPSAGALGSWWRHRSTAASLARSRPTARTMRQWAAGHEGAARRPGIRLQAQVCAVRHSTEPAHWLMTWHAKEAKERWKRARCARIGSRCGGPRPVAHWPCCGPPPSAPGWCWADRSLRRGHSVRPGRSGGTRARRLPGSRRQAGCARGGPRPLSRRVRDGRAATPGRAGGVVEVAWRPRGPAHRRGDRALAGLRQGLYKERGYEGLGLVNRDVMAHAVLTEGQHLSIKAREVFGPARYSDYQVTVILLTDRGVAKITKNLDFRKGELTPGEREKVFSYDAISSADIVRVEVKFDGDHRTVIELDEDDASDRSRISAGRPSGQTPEAVSKRFAATRQSRPGFRPARQGRRTSRLWPVAPALPKRTGIL